MNGDLLDCQAISRFPKSYRIPTMEELINGREYFIEVIEYINPKKVLITDGNHDVRIGSYLSKNLNTDLLELMPNSANEYLFEDGFTHYNKRAGCKTKYDPISKLFDSIEITYVNDWKVKVGRAWFAHPFAFSSGTLKTCERAMTHFFKTDRDGFDLVCLGHTHRTAHSKNGFVNLYEQGACCDTDKMLYTSGRLSDPQKEGFLYVCQDKEGNTIESKTKLIYLN